jgi:hypothetical protein
MTYNIEDFGREYFVSQGKCLKLDLQFPYEEMLAEAKAMREHFVRYHVNTHLYKQEKWFSLSLHGYEYNKPSAYTAYPEYTNPYDAINDFKWTWAAEHCPITVNWLKNTFPTKKFGRVRFMLLEAGGWIQRHFDSDEPVIEAVNMALNNPEGCVWNWDDGTTLDYKSGDMYALNLHHYHAIENTSNEDRYHMIVHHHDSTPEWKALMNNAAKEQGIEGTFVYSTRAY